MKNKAFTLIETILSITIMVLVITAVAGLVISTKFASTRNIHQVQALFLAQEGIEAMRYIRDSNWLQNYAWDEGSAAWGADFGSHESLYLSETDCAPCWHLSTQEEDGLIQLAKDEESGEASGVEFLRTVYINEVTADDLGDYVEEGFEILVDVSWNEKGTERNVELATFLTDWK